MKKTAAAMAVLVTIGCASTTEAKRATSAPTAAAQKQGAAEQAAAEQRAATTAAALPSTNPVYFAFDSALVDDKGELDRLTYMAGYLRDHKDARLVVEGHADERGTNEYNIALGDQRARVVIDYLRKLGVEDAQVSLVSYGEEHPAVGGHDEDAWRQNRRDELKLARPL